MTVQVNERANELCFCATLTMVCELMSFNIGSRHSIAVDVEKREIRTISIFYKYRSNNRRLYIDWLLDDGKDRFGEGHALHVVSFRANMQL